MLQNSDVSGVSRLIGPGSLQQTLFVTGGAGFIGSSFLNLFVPRFPQFNFVNLDKLTYAGNLSNLEPIQHLKNYFFERIDIAESKPVEELFLKYAPDAVIHFAAESHVDRSIASPKEFLAANVIGTFNLLEASRKCWEGWEGKIFHHVSTDEVFGALGREGSFREDTPYDPSSPYSSTKAASDHLVRAWNRTYGLPVTLSNCSNNYGPRQFPEKLIPLMILNASEGKPLPVYGKGDNVRDWLYVDDHCEAIWEIVTRGRVGQTYNVGGGSEQTNLDVVETICDLVGDSLGKSHQVLRKLITFVADRPGHDFRYAIDATKIADELDWFPKESFETGMEKTIKWFLENPSWVNQVRSGEYRTWIDMNYSSR